MNGRVFIKAFSVGALILGASAALSACGSSGSSGTTSSGSTPSAASTATAGATQSGGSTASSTASGAGSTATAATAAATASGAGSAQNADSGSNACATGHVSVKLGSSDAGMTHRSVVLVFTNSGSSTCTLTGYPGATVTNNGQYNFAPYVNATRSLELAPPGLGGGGKNGSDASVFIPIG